MGEVEEIKKRKMEEVLSRMKYPDKPIEVSDGDFDEIVGKYPLILVDFWSERCPPCVMIAPVIEEMARELSGKVVFGKVDVDRNREKAMKFGIMSIPTLMIFREGKPVDQIIGAVPKEYIMEKLKKHFE